MAHSLLAPDLEIKPSQLYVKNLQKLTKFYSHIVGLEILVKNDSHAILGHGNTPVLELISKPEYTFASIRSAGLFHNAIVYSTRSELAKTLYNILKQVPEIYEGPGNHLVSEAFYFHDPENNGLELYFDLPRETWEWENGQIKMDAKYIDVEKYILDNIHPEGIQEKKLGHVHLRIGDVNKARKFYADQLGFDITADLGSALFVSVGGYHHHLGMNTWASQGASVRDPSLGLGEVKFILPNDGSIDRLNNRLKDNNILYSVKYDNLIVDDPWGNTLSFTAG